MKKYLLVLVGVVMFLSVGVVGCSDDNRNNNATQNDNRNNNEGENMNEDNSIITGSIVMEDGGVIEFELYHDIAPQSVRNFVYLAQQGYYDGIRFHRIIPNFMIQTGCPNTREFTGRPGTGGPGYSIFGETLSNEFENNLKHVRGAISMAHSGHPDSGGSQFFICLASPSHLDGVHAVFGMVTGGMDVVDRIAETPNSGGVVDPDDMPVIRTITINGNVNLPEPDKILPR